MLSVLLASVLLQLYGIWCAGRPSVGPTVLPSANFMQRSLLVERKERKEKDTAKLIVRGAQVCRNRPARCTCKHVLSWYECLIITRSCLAFLQSIKEASSIVSGRSCDGSSCKKTCSKDWRRAAKSKWCTGPSKVLSACTWRASCHLLWSPGHEALKMCTRFIQAEPSELRCLVDTV
jgi:hypothetical protein